VNTSKFLVEDIPADSIARNEAALNAATKEVVEEYRSPCLVVLGNSKDLVQGTPSGMSRDSQSGFVFR